MAYKVLYRKYRPDSFENLFGQDNIKDILIESIKSEKISHAYIFHGPRGTGKTSTAKIFAKSLNCLNNVNGLSCDECLCCRSFVESPDIIEIDAASNNGVDEIRNLRESAKIMPTFSKYKVYIIDEVHMLSSSAWNAFLKILEEPPSHVIFILATTELQKIPLTILSRCQRFAFKKLIIDVIVKNIERISKLENISIDFDAMVAIAELADGAMRDALSILDQLSKENITITVDLITKTFGFIGSSDIKNIFKCLKNKDFNTFNLIFDDYFEKCLNVNLLINKLLSSLLDLEFEFILNNDFKFVNDLKKMSIDINSVYGKNNAIMLLKMILLSYSYIFSENLQINNVEGIVEHNTEIKNDKMFEEKNKKVDEMVINKDIYDKNKNKSNEMDIDLLKNVRLNNSYVNASKIEKNKFCEEWTKFVENAELSNERELLGMINSVVVQVVSPTNVTFSSNFISTAILFNDSLNEIEKKFNKFSNCNLKFICLTDEEWKVELKKYLEDMKNHTYEYIDENNINTKSKSVNAANDLFGDDILEIK